MDPLVRVAVAEGVRRGGRQLDQVGAIDHDAVAGLDAGQDLDQAAVADAELDLATDEGLAVQDHEDHLAPAVEHDGLLGHGDRVPTVDRLEGAVGQGAQAEGSVRVVELVGQGDRARHGVHGAPDLDQVAAELGQHVQALARTPGQLEVQPGRLRGPRVRPQAMQVELRHLQGQPEPPGIQDPEQARALVDLLGVLFNKVDTRTRISRQVREWMNETFPSKAFATQIPDLVAIKEAPFRNTSVLNHKPHSPASEAFRDLAREVVERGRS